MIKIRLFGIDDTRTNLLRKNLLDAFYLFPINFELSFINDIAEMTLAKIGKIPALEIDGTIEFEGVIPSTEELITLFKGFDTGNNNFF